MKMVAPAAIGHFVFDNVEYERDEDGSFEIKHPDHIAAARIHGATEFNPDAPHLSFDNFALAARVPSEFDATIADQAAVIEDLKAQLAGATPNETIAAQRGEIEDLKAQLLAAQSSRPAPGLFEALGGENTRTGTEGTEDTSEKAGGTDAAAKAALLATKPDADDYDGMKSWLTEAGVSFPGNVSKVRAAEIVAETVAALETPASE